MAKAKAPSGPVVRCSEGWYRYRSYGRSGCYNRAKTWEPDLGHGWYRAEDTVKVRWNWFCGVHSPLRRIERRLREQADRDRAAENARQWRKQDEVKRVNASLLAAAEAEVVRAALDFFSTPYFPGLSAPATWRLVETCAQLERVQEEVGSAR